IPDEADGGGLLATGGYDLHGAGGLVDRHGRDAVEGDAVDGRVDQRGVVATIGQVLTQQRLRGLHGDHVGVRGLDGRDATLRVQRDVVVDEAAHGELDLGVVGLVVADRLD